MELLTPCGPYLNLQYVSLHHLGHVLLHCVCTNPVFEPANTAELLSSFFERTYSVFLPCQLIIILQKNVAFYSIVQLMQ